MPTTLPSPPQAWQRLSIPSRPLSPTLSVRRALPVPDRRLVGAWTFLDHIGPVPAEAPALEVGAHPHIGLQTATWLFEGEILHRDSLGTAQTICPGQLNLMTAGHGIAHSEEGRAGALHGVQFWIALPAEAERIAPAFEHLPELPSGSIGGAELRVFIGQLGALRSAATVHSPLVGAELRITGPATLPLRPDFEHALMVVHGELRVEGEPLVPGELLYLGGSREQLRLQGEALAVLIGGEPLPEPRVLWWNFVARDWETIREARRAWLAGEARFPEVPGYPGERLSCPDLPG